VDLKVDINVQRNILSASSGQKFGILEAGILTAN
jgi:hypothetical protein